ncbi:MAG TPA: helix-turn-helix domain-containing protein [Gemmatimonadaceae bacterium]|nr:helix-turn-helix domain-containing protein [Gemmatimonadaceae bacterium]
MLLHACVFAPRERFRALARAMLPRRQWRLTMVRRPDRFAAAMRSDLVDAALVDLGAPGALTDVAPLAREMPLIPFLGCAPFGVGDAGMVARAAELGFADVLAEGVDDTVIGPMAALLAFTSRFATTLHDPPPVLGLTAPLQLAAWRAIVARAGRTLSTNEVARSCRVSREHLSRTFAARDAPTLKEAIDLVRLLAAAQLAKCQAYDLADVARLLGFTSPSQLSRMARRVLGRGATSLPRLRGDDLVRLWARANGLAVARSQGP